MIISDLIPPYDIIIDQNNNAFIAEPGKTIGIIGNPNSSTITHTSTESFHGLTTLIESAPANNRLIIIPSTIIHIT